MKDVIILGGGLSGLTAAHLLTEKGLDVFVLEANHRLGGRIKTIKSKSNFPLEMGATWVFQDPYLRNLIQKLQLTLYPQYLKGEGFYEMSFMGDMQKYDVGSMTYGQEYHKVQGGSMEIITALEHRIHKDNILQNKEAIEIIDKGDFLEVHTRDGDLFQGKNIVVTIPPKLFATSVKLDPPSKISVTEKRAKAHTWMADSIKFSIEYKSAFWREKGLAGYGLSNVGMVREIQDHSNTKENVFGIVGFLQMSRLGYSLSKEERKKQVVRDLSRLLGEEAKNYIAYEDTLWALEKFTAKETDVNAGLYAHQFNGDAEIIRPEMHEKLFFAGAETSRTNPGYMEGAVKSAYRVTEEIIEKNKTTTYELQK